MQRICLVGMGAVLLSACAHHPVPVDCKTRLERINPPDRDPHKSAAKLEEPAKEDTP